MSTQLPPEGLAPPAPKPAEALSVPASTAATPVKMRKVALASFMGTVIPAWRFCRWRS